MRTFAVLVLLCLFNAAVATVTDTNAVLTATTNQLQLGTTNTVTISSTAPSASRTHTIPDPGANANFMLTKGSQTISGDLTMSKSTPILQILNTDAASTYAKLSMQGLSGLGYYETTHSSLGEVWHKNDNADGYFWYTKASGGSLKADMVLNPSAGTGGTSLSLYNSADSNGIRIKPATVSATRTYTLPEASADADFVVTASAQTLTGVKTFSNGLAFGGGGTTLNHYEEYTLTTNCYGPWTTRSCNLLAIRIGRMVSLFTAESVSATATITAGITWSSALPSQFRPAADTNKHPAYLLGSSTWDTSGCKVTSGGNVYCYEDLSESGFPSGNVINWGPNFHLTTYCTGSF